MSEITSTALPDCSDSGEQQRIALSHLILKGLSLILTDEPTSIHQSV